MFKTFVSLLSGYASYYATLCCVMLRYVVLRYALSMYVTLCYVQRSVEARADVTCFPYP